VAAIESDGGVEKPLGIGYGGFGGVRRPQPPPPGAAAAAPAWPSFDESALSPEEKQSFDILRDLVSLLSSIGTDTVSPGGGGSDIGPIVADGVPSLSPRTVGEHYFDWHHTEADTLDKVDPDSFKRNTAMLSVVAYVLADMDGRLAGHKGSVRE
jgi:Zn-dependent M28 family amino/carboxypeptidase